MNTDTETAELQLKVDLVTTMEGFAGLAQEWNSLLKTSLADSIFLRHDWLFTWWEAFGGHGTLSIVLVRDGGTNAILGILPTYIDVGRPLPAIRTLKYLGGYGVGADFLDCIVDQDRASEVLTFVVKYLRQACGKEWDVLSLNDMDTTSEFYALLCSCNDLDIHCTRDGFTPCPYLKLSGDWDTFFKELSSKMKHKIKTRRRTFVQAGAVTIEHITSAAQIDDALRDHWKFRSSRLNAKGVAVRPMSEAYRRFHSTVCTKFLEQGLLRLAYMAVGEERIALVYGFAFNGRYYYYQTSFNEAWAKQSVGFILLGYEIERAIGDGCHAFEFLRGEEPYKYDWGEARERKLGQIILFSSTVRGTVCRLLHGAYDLAREIKRFVGRRVAASA